MTTPDFCHKTKYVHFLVNSSCSILDLSMGGNLEIVNNFHLLQRETDVSKSSSPPSLLTEQNSSMLKFVCPQSLVKMSNCTLAAVFSRPIPYGLRDVLKKRHQLECSISNHLYKILKGICLGCTLPEVCE